MKKRTLMLLLAVALLVTCAVFTVHAETPTLDNTTPVAFNKATDKCPCCGEIVPASDWTELTAPTSNANLAAGHYIVSEDLTWGTKYYSISAGTGGKKVVILLEADVTCATENNIFRFGANTTTYNADTICTGYLLGAGGSIKGPGAVNTASTKNGSLMRIGVNGVLYIKNNVTIEATGTATAGKGGLFDIYKGHVYMDDGTLKGINATSETIETYGTVIVRDGGSFTMTGGRIVGGTATLGGAIYTTGAASEVTVGGDAYIEGGTVTSGGAIYVANGAVTVQENAYIKGGTATNGGTIYVKAGSLDMSGGTITGGTATTGGALYVEDGEVEMNSTTAFPNGPTITGGTATGTAKTNGGGVIFYKGGSFTMNKGTITGGTCKFGSTIMLGGDVTFIMKDGTINGGSSTVSASQGGVAFVPAGTTFDMQGGTVNVTDASNAVGARGFRVEGGTVALSGNAQVNCHGLRSGDAIDLVSLNKNNAATLTLAGSATVQSNSGSWNNVIHAQNYGNNPTKVSVTAGWTGSASVRYEYLFGSKNKTEDYAIAMPIGASYGAATGDFTGNLYMEAADDLPKLYWDGATGLRVGDVQLHKLTDDGTQISWYATNAAAVTAYASETTTDRYIKLYNSKAIDLAGNDVFVDFNGQKNVAVTTGNGTLYGFDSTSSNTNAGQATASLTGTAETFVTNPVTGESSVTFTEGNVTTFHTIKPVISGVSLRPGVAGLYYTGQVLCDAALAPYVSEYGVAVKLDGMPGEDFRTTSWYTLEETLEDPSEPFHGMLVQKILKGGNDDDDRAQRAIYANAYVTVTVDGQSKTYLSSNSGNAASMDLKTMVRKVNGIYRTLNETQKTGINGMYETYQTLMSASDWRLHNIVSSNGDGIYKGDEDGLQVLMIGNSLSVDAGHMLAYVFAQQGVDNVRISTLYHSGCTLAQHVGNIGTPFYTFYDNEYTSAEDFIAGGAYAPSLSARYSYTMADGIEEDEWDIVVMQQGTVTAAQAKSYNEDIKTIMDYVNERQDTPPVYIWNSVWASPHDMINFASNGRDPDTSSSVYYALMGFDNEQEAAQDLTAQIRLSDMITDAVRTKIMTNNAYDYFIPSGTAQLNAWSSCLENVDLYRDYVHASDLGRLMNSYVWYSAITGDEITSADIVSEIPLVLLNTSDEIVPAAKAPRPVTDLEQKIMLESIQNAFKTPLSMTQSQYTEYPAQTGEEAENLRILLIGDEATANVVSRLEDVYAEQNPTQKVTVASLYCDNASVYQHVKNVVADSAVYTYKNGDAVRGEFKLTDGIKDQQWDIILLQSGATDRDMTGLTEAEKKNEDIIKQFSRLNQTSRRDLERIIKANMKTPDSLYKLAWHTAWSDPTGDTFDPAALLTEQIDLYQTYVDHDATYAYKLCTGTAIVHAYQALGEEAMATLWEDGSLTEAGQLVAAYTLYAQLNGTQLTGAELADEAVRTVVLDAANYAQATPWTVPSQS